MGWRELSTVSGSLLFSTLHSDIESAFYKTVLYGKTFQGSCAFTVTEYKTHFVPCRLPPPGQLTDPSVAKEGTASGDFERDTWPELSRLAQDLPEAGVHFQGRL